MADQDPLVAAHDEIELEGGDTEGKRPAEGGEAALRGEAAATPPGPDIEKPAAGPAPAVTSSRKKARRRALGNRGGLNPVLAFW